MFKATASIARRAARALSAAMMLLLLAAPLSIVPTMPALASPQCGFDWWGNVICVGPNTYVAIAISESSWAWGSSWHANSQQQAEAIALANCRKYARDCKAQIWAQNACAAYATSEKDGFWGTGWAMYVDIAEARALGECRRAGGKYCVVKAHPCADD